MITDFFPFDTPRELQIRTLNTVDRAFQDKSVVLLESPVGTGKSPMGMTFARRARDSYILTPRVQLQDQYYEDFRHWVVTLKGRSRYPCLDPLQAGTERFPGARVLSEIASGNISPLFSGDKPACDTGRCLSDVSPESYIKSCEVRSGFPCPYLSALELAKRSHHVVSNVHGFVAHSKIAGRFDPRPLLVVDECHDLADAVRSSMAEEFVIRNRVLEHPGQLSQEDWVEFFLAPDRLPQRPRFSPSWGQYVEEFHKWLELVRRLPRSICQFTIERESTRVCFTPINVQRACRDYILSRGDRSLFMSGTIYQKTMFCREIGLDPEEVAYVRVNSTFPVENRPVIFDGVGPMGMRDWDRNFGRLVDYCRRILDRHPEEKGLIHTSSYAKAQQLAEALGPRTVTHSSENFNLRLQDFFSTPQPKVFISPVCQQGVDFKNDRARFQIITTVPYLNVGDPMVAALSENPVWYRLRTLIIFGQQLGRPVRNEQDTGITYLADSRFRGFIHKCRQWIPDWQWRAFRGI